MAKRLLEQRGRVVEATDVPVVLGQAVHGLQRLGVFGAELGLHERDRLLVELESIIEAVEDRVAAGQHEAASERVDVLGAELGNAPRERFFTKLERLGLVAESGAGVGQVVHTFKSVRVIGAESIGEDRARPAKLIGRGPVVAEIPERHPQRHAQAGFDERLGGEASLHDRQRGVERLSQRHVRAESARPVHRPGRGEDVVLHEAEHSLRVFPLFGFAPLRRECTPLGRPGLQGLPGAHGRPACQQQGERRRRAERATMLPGELPQAISG